MEIRLMTTKILLSINQIFAARDSSCYILLRSDISENIVDLTHKKGDGI